MAFSDLFYLPFLGLVALILPLIPQGSPRLLATVLISLGFYAGLSPGYWYVLVGVAALTYLGGLVLSRLPESGIRGAVFLALLIATFLPLLIFKGAATLYQLLPAESDLAGGWSAMANLILPIGTSFYSFLAAGYLIDVYVGSVPAERNAIRFGAFMCFFPQLTAGPIERARHLLPQLENIGQFDYDRAVAGLRAILTGLFLKIVIADSLAFHVNAVYFAPREHPTIDLALAVVYFSFQVYADFAGYSLIAIGSARLLGVELPTNFTQPWLSQNIAEFWRRWHISLSSWFRDYVFTPLQFEVRRWGAYGLAAALVLTFVLVGIWHGAGLKFALFGLMHGVLVAFSTLTFARRDKFWQSFGVSRSALFVGRAVATFLIVSLTFVMFRASSVPEALWIYDALFNWVGGTRTTAWTGPLVVIVLLVAYDLFARWGRDLDSLPSWLRWAAYYAAIASIIRAGSDHLLQDPSHVQQFIYFKF
jgi:alginate O-acetyltransferase complex protein AlgI